VTTLRLVDICNLFGVVFINLLRFGQEAVAGFLGSAGASLFYLWLLQYCQLLVFSPYVETSFKSKHLCKKLKF